MRSSRLTVPMAWIDQESDFLQPNSNDIASLLEVRDITVRFGTLVANDHVCLKCEKGEIISLLGENGAGKTTLMKAIYGMNKLESGKIWFEGKEQTIRSPRDSIRLGIQMVHQHFMLVDHLTVAENIVLGAEPQKFGFYSKQETIQQVTSLSEAYGLAVNPHALVSELSVGEKQRVEIIKALYHGAKLLILDEPTAVLTPQESADLFTIIRRLKNDGKSIIIITHKLHETMEIADTICVMRKGQMVGSVKKEETTIHDLAYMMVNHELKPFEKPVSQFGDVAIRMENVRLKNRSGKPVLDGASLFVRAGEIYGIAGIEGNGQMELAEVFSGIAKGWSGTVELLSQSIAEKSVLEIIQMGVSCIHLDRHDRGLLLDLDAGENTLLGYQNAEGICSKRGLLDRKENYRVCQEIFSTYNVSPQNTHQLMRSFSGGNQQKILVGREFYRNPKAVLVAYPTRGVDIGVSEIIHQKILELRQAGAAILLITADFDELFKLSDRIGVLYEGRITREGTSEDFTPDILGYYMGGGTADEAT